MRRTSKPVDVRLDALVLGTLPRAPRAHAQRRLRQHGNGLRDPLLATAFNAARVQGCHEAMDSVQGERAHGPTPRKLTADPAHRGSFLEPEARNSAGPEGGVLRLRNTKGSREKWKKGPWAGMAVAPGTTADVPDLLPHRGCESPRAETARRPPARGRPEVTPGGVIRRETSGLCRIWLVFRGDLQRTPPAEIAEIRDE